jgi:hypothetical protein
MKALTLHRPWAWAIAHGGKRIENRSWPFPRSLRGERIAIHAGKTWNEGALASLLGMRLAAAVPRTQDRHPVGIVATAVLHCVLTPDEVRGAFVEQAPWAIGPECWLLAKVHALPAPVPCAGAQGLWEVPAELLPHLEPGAPPYVAPQAAPPALVRR